MSDRRRGCIRAGCWGCAGCAVILLGVVALLVVIGGLLERGDPQWEEIDTAHAVPGSVPVVPSVPDGGASADAVPDPAIPSAAGRPPARQPGTILVDVGLTRFEIVPGPAGDPIRVEGRYNESHYELSESFEETTDGGWAYSLRFGARSLLHSFLPIEIEADDRVRLIVPRDLPFHLVGGIGIGESDLELGGLSLVSVELDTGIGEHHIRFSEPLPAPLERLAIAGGVGELEVASVGNASPASTRIQHNLGEMVVDLGGAWTRDGEVEVEGGIGACRVVLPRGVHLAVEAGVSIGESVQPTLPEAPEGAPTVTVRATGRVGEVRVE
jgi:hypothetical protein